MITTVLFLGCARDFNPDNDEDFGFLWDVWYNMDWPEETRKRFLSVVKELMNEELPENVSVPNSIHCEKNQCLFDFWEILYPEKLQEKAQLENADIFPNEMAEQIFFQFKVREGFIGLDPCVRKKIYDEVLKNYRNGSNRLQKNDQPVCANPTMLNPETHDWETLWITPFEGYLPMAKGELITSAEQIMTQSCSGILKRLVSSYRSTIKTIEIIFHLGEAVEFCYSDANKFDVIDCSNFVDHVGLANLVVACCQKLSDNPNAVFYTEIMTDNHHSANTIVETSLCAPLSMIPTIYGLRLADHVELRDSAVDYLRCNTPHNRTSSESLLAKNICQLEITPQFSLAREVLEDWKNGKKKKKILAGVQHKVNSAAKKEYIHQLRLVFVPWASYMRNPVLSGPDVHFIDNFELELKHSLKETAVETVSFLLARDHCFDEKHCAVLFNAFNGLPLLILDPFESMRVEECYLPFPVDQSKSKVPLHPKERIYMNVKSCIESEEQYTLRIAIECDGNVSGMKISTNEQPPCESCHEITVSLTQPSEIQPLSLTFPFPILAKNVQATLHPKSRHVDLLLKKFLLEPWPCEFHSKKSKWIIDDLVPWENVPLTPKNVFNSLGHHLSSQQLSKDINLSHFLDPKSSALDKLRIKLGVMMLRDIEFVSYGRNDDRYLLKLHRPLLTSPMGTPILLITALNGILSRKLGQNVFTIKSTVLNGRMDHDKICEKVFFPFGTPKDKWVVDAETEEEFQLFRFLLRLNSTRIEPSKWQKENIPLGGSSPWLATFFSPLYQDSESKESNDDEQADEKCCAVCKKIPEKLKRCSRCRSTFYCSVECQHSHWPMHKILCKKL
ncbi:hypothetical protein DAPPUDRAFT_237975 [Daphnia pulex]|uniref:MYND-type domain-containing protein n=1 Tax=Daphnia pulex TaxID=6669 RepID=E9G4W5_DAPPU|nr:hypothetical protein DAPPUDRAFT_237975 [Daphnia pulex]|eukprot:EFX85370.1 hypothetical protein DAPPUDRAFT_237975 [Daphnia pulex]